MDNFLLAAASRKLSLGSNITLVERDEENPVPREYRAPRFDVAYRHGKDTLYLNIWGDNAKDSMVDYVCLAVKKHMSEYEFLCESTFTSEHITFIEKSMFAKYGENLKALMSDFGRESFIAKLAAFIGGLGEAGEDDFDFVGVYRVCLERYFAILLDDHKDYMDSQRAGGEFFHKHMLGNLSI